MMKLEYLYKVGSECELKSWPDSSVRQSVRIQWSWVQIPFGPTLYSYFKESFSGEYHMYQLIPPQSCDYLMKISIKTNVATNKGNILNETCH